MPAPVRPAGDRSYRRARPDAPRLAAFDLLRAVDERDAYANLVLPGLLRERHLDGRDAAFATELGYGTLRGRGLYDAVLSACVDRPLTAVDPPVVDVLRLGAHQLLAMRTPSHAAVSATVELARGVVGDSRSRFVNAVLRKVSQRSLPAWVRAVAPPYGDDPLGHLAVAHSHPRWIVSALRDAVHASGGGLAETALLLEADNEPAGTTLVARPGRSSVDELLAAGAEPGRWSPYAVRWSGDPGSLRAVVEGRAGVQDEGSQLVALALARVPIDGTDRAWLDLCAGPGGKAALLGALAAQRSPRARLVAAELAPHRARLVARTAGSTAAAVVADALAPAWRPGAFDRVLVDAPCSGLGALRRRPEARWRREPQDIAGLGGLQRGLLASGLEAVRPGGVIAYVTCSPHLAETVVVVADVLRGRADIERLDAREHLRSGLGGPGGLGGVGGLGGLGAGPDVQLWPHRHGTDAMYLALLRRIRAR